MLIKVTFFIATGISTLNQYHSCLVFIVYSRFKGGIIFDDARAMNKTKIYSGYTHLYCLRGVALEPICYWAAAVVDALPTVAYHRYHFDSNLFRTFGFYLRNNYCR